MSCLLNPYRFKLCFDSDHSMYTLYLLIVLLSVAFSRVPEEERTFSSVVIDKYLVGIKDKFKDPELADLFESCYPNTLDTTVYSFTDNPEGDEDTFLITGDITAMWLRDSTNQVRFGRWVNSRSSHICVLQIATLD